MKKLPSSANSILMRLRLVLMIHITGLSSLDGGAGDVMAPSIFDLSVNPISTRGADFATKSLLAPPDFQTFLHSCNVHMLIMNVSSSVQDVKIQMRLTWMA